MNIVFLDLEFSRRKKNSKKYPFEIIEVGYVVTDMIGNIKEEYSQFIRVEEGMGLVQMGDSKENLIFEKRVGEDFAVMIPAGKWHNIINIGKEPLKLYSIYAPPHHPKGTVQKTKSDKEH